MPHSEPASASMVDLTVIAPCFNEEDNLGALTSRLLATFRKHGISGQIVLVNDASTDRTGARIEALAAAHPEVLGAHHQTNRGLSAGWDTGLRAATGKYVCFIDADLQNPPEEVWRLYREITTSHADVVQGVRSSIGRLKGGRYILSRGLNRILNVTFGMAAADNKSGFVMALRDTMVDLLQRRYRYDFFHTFISVAAHAKGYSIKEVETLFQDRTAGMSYMQAVPVGIVARVGVDLVKALVEYRLRRGADDSLARFLRDHEPRRPPHAYRGWRRLWYEVYFLTTPLHKWMITTRCRRMLELLKRTEWLALAEIKELQESRLRRLVRHAYHHVPYYTRGFDAAGIRPEDIRTLDDLTRLPLLSKQEVREHLYFDLFADTHDKREMLRISTSGSSGEPLVTFADRTQLEMRAANTLRALEWTGWRFGDRQVRLWHQTLGLSRTQVWRERFDALLMRRLFIPAYEIRDDNLKDFVDAIRTHRPVLVDGYAESFHFLARYAQKYAIPGFHPKAIMTSAQTMPEQVRHMIEEHFGAKVFDKYGSREFSGIAYECQEQDGHHVMAESYVVEILHNGCPAAPGQIGEVVITDLNNFSVPLIRYRIGDLAVATDNTRVCACGRGLPRIGRIEGRAHAIVVGANGAWLPGTFFAHLFKDYDHGIRQFQVVQREVGGIELKIVKGLQYSDRLEAELCRELRRFLGDGMRIDVTLVDAIPLGRTGKRTPVVSHLDLDFQEVQDVNDAPTAGAAAPGTDSARVGS